VLFSWNPSLLDQSSLRLCAHTVVMRGSRGVSHRSRRVRRLAGMTSWGDVSSAWPVIAVGHAAVRGVQEGGEVRGIGVPVARLPDRHRIGRTRRGGRLLPDCAKREFEANDG
jgi:hypothetical protein